ncbi:hypothetical protein J2Z69_002741 [Paenibacillus shirakamiensis]|uniref:Uncharacterized protein n=1 Tax=Paenibacillus shirakamiensis TaxID=1265935 RepID=A0ABS4JJ14_9BACL|nr:hypothetical protein [Paenibacillus shirakamiensis]MBP2001696.1 hypothetical protein [Paenibacillus shirakamiensis]
MTTPDPKDLLKSKHEADKHKAQFTQFARHVIGDSSHELGQDIMDQSRIPDQQNKMKSVENRQLE